MQLCQTKLKETTFHQRNKQCYLLEVPSGCRKQTATYIVNRYTSDINHDKICLPNIYCH